MADEEAEKEVGCTGEGKGIAISVGEEAHEEAAAKCLRERQRSCSDKGGPFGWDTARWCEYHREILAYLGQVLGSLLVSEDVNRRQRQTAFFDGRDGERERGCEERFP